MRGEVGKETPQKEMDFYDVTHDTLGFLLLTMIMVVMFGYIQQLTPCPGITPLAPAVQIVASCLLGGVVYPARVQACEVRGVACSGGQVYSCFQHNRYKGTKLKTLFLHFLKAKFFFN